MPFYSSPLASEKDYWESPSEHAQGTVVVVVVVGKLTYHSPEVVIPMIL